MADLIALRSGDSEATVAPAIGANCCAFRIGGRDVLEPAPSSDALSARPTGYGCPILFPFPGQHEPGRLHLLGRDVEIAANAPTGRHGHGFAPRRPWRVVERTEDSCACQIEGGGGDDYPWWFRITARWRVTPGTLGVGLLVENLDQVEMPFGIGLHPYLVVDRDAVIEVPTVSAWPHDSGIPSGPPAPTDMSSWRWGDLPTATSLLLTDLPPGDAEARAGRALLRWPTDRFGEVVVYRPPERRSVCVEPWTSVSNAAAQLDPGAPHGLIRLAPAAKWSGWLEVVVSEHLS